MMTVMMMGLHPLRILFSQSNRKKNKLILSSSSSDIVQLKESSDALRMIESQTPFLFLSLFVDGPRCIGGCSGVCSTFFCFLCHNVFVDIHTMATADFPHRG